MPTTKPPWKGQLPRAAAELVQLLGLYGEAFDEFGVVLSDGSFQSLEHAALTGWQLVVGHVGHLVVARADPCQLARRRLCRRRGSNKAPGRRPKIRTHRWARSASASCSAPWNTRPSGSRPSDSVSHPGAPPVRAEATSSSRSAGKASDDNHERSAPARTASRPERGTWPMPSSGSLATRFAALTSAIDATTLLPSLPRGSTPGGDRRNAVNAPQRERRSGPRCSEDGACGRRYFTCPGRTHVRS